MIRAWHRALVEEHSVKIVFVNYAKAFDHVDHKTVMTNLSELVVAQIFIYEQPSSTSQHLESGIWLTGHC